MKKLSWTASLKCLFEQQSFSEPDEFDEQAQSLEMVSGLNSRMKRMSGYTPNCHGRVMSPENMFLLTVRGIGLRI